MGEGKAAIPALVAVEHFFSAFGAFFLFQLFAILHFNRDAAVGAYHAGPRFQGDGIQARGVIMINRITDTNEQKQCHDTACGDFAQYLPGEPCSACLRSKSWTWRLMRPAYGGGHQAVELSLHSFCQHGYKNSCQKKGLQTNDEGRPVSLKKFSKGICAISSLSVLGKD